MTAKQEKQNTFMKDNDEDGQTNASKDPKNSRKVNNLVQNTFENSEKEEIDDDDDDEDSENGGNNYGYGYNQSNTHQQQQDRDEEDDEAQEDTRNKSHKKGIGGKKAGASILKKK